MSRPARLLGALSALWLLAACDGFPGAAPDDARPESAAEDSLAGDEPGLVDELINRASQAVDAVLPGGDQGLAEVALTGGIVARAPAGYCVDPRSRDGDSARRVAIMASCDRISGQSQGAEVPSAIMTVTVGRARVLGGPDITGSTLAAAFADKGPRAADDGPGLAIVQLERGGDAEMPGAAPVHWRGVLDLNGRLVGLAVYVPQGSALVGARGGALLRDLAEEVRDASVAARSGLVPEGDDG